MSDLRGTFDRFDTDGSGRIAVESIGALIRALGGEARCETAVAALSQLATKTPGQVTFDEFRAWWEAHASSTITTSKVRPYRDKREG